MLLPAVAIAAYALSGVSSVSKKGEGPPNIGVPSPLPDSEPITLTASLNVGGHQGSAFPATASGGTVRAVALKPADEMLTATGMKARIGGKWIAFSKRNHRWIALMHVGRDGSAVIRRSTYYEGAGVQAETSIWANGKETNAAYGDIRIYRDAQNYAGMLYARWEDDDYADGAGQSYVVKNGQKRDLGPGGPSYWNGEETYVLGSYIDEGRNAVSAMFAEGFASRILSPKGTLVLPDYEFLGASSGGKIVMAGLADTPAKDTILVVRKGTLEHRYNLPSGWRAFGVAPAGWILMRHSKRGSGPLVDESQLVGKKTDEVIGELNRAFDRDSDLDTKMERDWTIGVLQEGRLTSIDLPHPKGSERLLWRSEATDFRDDGFRFHAFWDQIDREFWVTLPPAVRAPRLN